MVHINLITLGKLKETYLKEAVSEYSKRLSKYCKLNIYELADEPIPDKVNSKIIENIKNIEGTKIMPYMKNGYNIALALEGRQYSSEEFSIELENIFLNKNSTINFIIGGSLGLSDEVIENSNKLICFSKMTFPHQLIRVFLLEQIYRAFKIQNNESYHK